MLYRLLLVLLLLPPVAALGPVATADHLPTRPRLTDAGENGGRGDDRRAGAGAKRDRDRGRRDHRGDRDLVIETGRLPGADDPAAAKLPGYNIVFDEDVADPLAAAQALAKEFDAVPTYVFRDATKGFAGRMDRATAARLARDPRVKIVSPARTYRRAAQTLPTGVDRVEADRDPLAAIDGVDGRVDVDVMVIDDGVALHPDLNVVRQIDFTGQGHTNGAHGTHVAGTIGALDNGDGVVGVAPGARIWSADVFVGNVATDTAIIAALAVAADPANGIEVVNLSLGGPGPPTTCADNAFHAAVCETVAAGVTVVVAAGNGASDGAGFVLANFGEAIAVSAVEDRDGAPGNDRFASFSNFGAAIDIAAPGVAILSTVPDGSYGAFSGTSMAAPHVAGAAALYKAANPGVTPAQVRQALLANRENVALSGDPDGSSEGILNVAGLTLGVPIAPVSPPPPAPPAAPAPGDSTPPEVRLAGRQRRTVDGPFTLRATATDASGIRSVTFFACSPSCRRIGRPDPAPPYQVWVQAPPGIYRVFARAVDKAGNVAESVRATVRIGAGEEEEGSGTATGGV